MKHAQLWSRVAVGWMLQAAGVEGIDSTCVSLQSAEAGAAGMAV